MSPLVYFICHPVNKVLELPVRLRHMLENSGWQRERDHLEEHDVGTLVDGLERESVEADSVDLQNEWTSTSTEVTAWVNFDLLRGWTWRHQHAVTESSVGSESIRRRHERATLTVRGKGGEERKNTRRRSVKR